MDPVVKQMLDTLHSPSLDIHVKEEFHKLPPCEITGHATDLTWHDPSAPAAYWVISPCGGEKFACALWVAGGSVTPFTDCKKCGHKHRSSEYTYIPLNMKEEA